MMKYALITAFVVLIIAVITRVSIKHRNKRREQKAVDFNNEVLMYLTQILFLADQGNCDARGEVMRIWRDYSSTLRRDFPNMHEQYMKMNISILDAIEFEEKLPKLRTLFAEYEEGTGIEERLVLYTEFYQYWRGCSMTLQERLSTIADEMEAGAVGTILASLVQSRMDELAQQANSDPVAFKNMIELSQEIINHGGAYYSCREVIEYPSNWNDLIAQYVKNPHYTEFIGTKDPSDFPSGLTRRMAAEALRSEDYTSAKIALSYCNCNKNVLTEVGSVLTADLAKFVAKREAEIQASTETES